jgi:hypothetical protein
VQPLLLCKAVSVTYSEGVFAALIIQHAKRMRHTVICCLSGSTIFLYIPGEKKVTENKMRALIFSKTFVRKISHSKKNGARHDQ